MGVSASNFFPVVRACAENFQAYKNRFVHEGRLGNTHHGNAGSRLHSAWGMISGAHENRYPT